MSNAAVGSFSRANARETRVPGEGTALLPELLLLETPGPCAKRDIDCAEAPTAAFTTSPAADYKMNIWEIYQQTAQLMYVQVYMNMNR